EWRVLRRCRQGEVDILHCLDGERGVQYLPDLPSWLLRSRPAFLATFHQPPDRLRALVDPRVYSGMDRIIVLCPEQVDFVQQYVPGEKVVMLLHGVDTGFFCPADRCLVDNHFRCLSVGYHMRDYEMVLQIADRLVGETGIEFHIVSSAVEGMRLPANVRVYGRLSDEELRRLYQTSDVLFLPLLGATANNTIVEAIACGLPVVTTDLPALRTYLTDQEAILVEGRAPERYVDALLYLRRDADLRAAMGRCARTRAEELSWSRIAPLYESLYETVAVERDRGRG
ncbi:MAG: glycosyltransferase family 4 protein, partial [Anaerolineae bacterium]|nr:glycosyltransferase family 4 protein [Anaerolineae bacterium]